MNKVYLYLFDINKQDSLNNLPYLLEEDLENAKRFKQQADHDEHLVSSYLKRKYVKDYFLDENKKPKSNNVFFNVSHSKNVVIMGKSASFEIGVDIEKIRDVEEDLINYISSKEEKEYIKNNTNFFEVWTLKESLAKAQGLGITNKVSSIPALPLNGTKEYLNDTYRTKIMYYEDYVIAICIKSSEEFQVEVINEKL